jgi:hypothetical protein
MPNLATETFRVTVVAYNREYDIEAVVKYGPLYYQKTISRYSQKKQDIEIIESKFLSEIEIEKVIGLGTVWYSLIKKALIEQHDIQNRYEEYEGEFDDSTPSEFY